MNVFVLACELEWNVPEQTVKGLCLTTSSPLSFAPSPPPRANVHPCINLYGECPVVHQWCDYEEEGYPQFSSVASRVRLFETPWTAARQASLFVTNSQSLPKPMSIELMMPSSHLISSPSPPAFNLSQNQGLFRWVSSLHQVASFGVSASTSVLPMNTQEWSPLGWTGWFSLQSNH